MRLRAFLFICILLLGQPATAEGGAGQTDTSADSLLVTYDVASEGREELIPACKGAVDSIGMTVLATPADELTFNVLPDRSGATWTVGLIQTYAGEDYSAEEIPMFCHFDLRSGKMTASAEATLDPDAFAHFPTAAHFTGDIPYIFDGKAEKEKAETACFALMDEGEESGWFPLKLELFYTESGWVYFNNDPRQSYVMRASRGLFDKKAVAYCLYDAETGDASLLDEPPESVKVFFAAMLEEIWSATEDR